MNPNRKEELLTLFSISLALVAASILVYMAKNPSITGMAAFVNNSSSSMLIISLLILIGLALVIKAITTIHVIHKEKEAHVKAMLHNNPLIHEHPNSKIVEYIMNARKNNISDSKIAKRLHEEGWEKKIIKKYL